MTEDQTAARDRAIEIVNETIGFDRSKVEADVLASEIVASLLARPEVLRALAADATAQYGEVLRDLDDAERILETYESEADEPGPRERLFREYLIRIATKIGHRSGLALDNVHDIERVGEAVMAELERREDATVNSELKVPAVNSPADVYNLGPDPRVQRVHDRSRFSDAEQAELDDLRERMEAGEES